MNHKLENKYDGFLDLDVREDGTYLIIYTPNEGGKRVTLESAVEFLRLREIENYDKIALRSALASEKEREVLKLSNNAILEKADETATIDISKNKMFSVISFKPPQNGGKLLTKDDIISLLNGKRIVFGIDNKVIDQIIADKKYNYKYLIARGIEPINGKDGELKFHFDLAKKMIKPKIEDDGSVNFRDLDLIEMVNQGQVLVTAIPPSEGRSGKNIFGEEVINTQGKEAIWPMGKNVKISDDGKNLVSEINGQITYLDGKISVYSTYEVPANVDNSTGNIDFNGNVVVKGNVLTGFSIKAKGNIEVKGVVEGAELDSGGDIILYRGMQGSNKGILKADGTIVAKYIENSNISSRGDIQANAIMHSEVKCGGSICVEGKKGLLVGGSIHAAHEISATTIGSPMATSTELEVGIDPDIIENYRNLKEQLEIIKEEINKMSQIVNPLMDLKNNDKLPADKEDKLDKALKTKTFLQSKSQSIQGELEILEPKIQNRNKGSIKAHNIVYPGVKVTIGSVYTYIREEHKFCNIMVDHGEITFFPYA